CHRSATLTSEASGLLPSCHPPRPPTVASHITPFSPLVRSHVADPHLVLKYPVPSTLPAIAEAGPESESTATPVISVQDIVHRYNGRSALDHVSFDVRPAELFGLLGPNGSGKTTLFRILSTLMVPTAGRALIMGFDTAKDPAAVRRQIGVVFQAQSVDEKLTAYENLWHQGHLYGLHGSPLKARINEILDRVGLADRMKELVE